MKKNKPPSPPKNQKPVREGSESRSIAGDKPTLSNNKYPLPEENDNRDKDQPEFIDESPNRRNSKL